MKKTTQQMKRIQLLVAALFLVCSVGFAQLSGTYTIDSASATAGTNYQTFTAAVSALATNGVSGAVTFNVAKGTYVEQISIPAITGASTTNTISFKGLGDATTITAAPSSLNRPVVSLDSTSHITLDSLKIEVTGAQGWGVHFMNHADTNSVLNCHITGPSALNIYGIVASGSISTVSVVQNNAEYILIQNNLIEGCDRSIQMVGMTGPLTTPSKQINYGTDISIVGNTMTNFKTKAVIINNYHNVTVESNVMSTSSSSCNGAASFWDAGDNLTFIKNNVYVSSNMSNTRLVALAMAPPNGPAGDSTKPGMIANNMIQYDGANAVTPTGLLLKNKAYIKVYNNTIKLKNQGSNANCIWLDNNNARSLHGIEIRNNVLVLENSGSGQFLFTANATIAARFENLIVDHNNYYAPNAYFNSKVANGTGLSVFTSFSAFKANTFGWGTGALNVDPGFVGATDLHATSVGMNDSGAVIAGVIYDIDGDTRSTSTPDIGADEYTPPSCLPATGISSFNIVFNSASIFWTQSNSSSTFKVQYGTSGFTLGSGTGLVSTNDTVAITGLNGQTTYDVYVMEVCSATDSSTWAGPLTFTTPCATINSFPYTETFNGTTWTSGTGSANTGDVIDPCWNKWPTSGSVFRWGTRTGSTGSFSTGPTAAYGGTGNYIYTEGSYGSTGAKTNLTSPTYDLSSLTVPQLTFQYHMYGSTMGTMMLWAWNGSAYDTVWTKSGGQGNQWVEEIVDLSAYKTQATHLRFHAVKGTSYSNDMAIDNIVIEEAPACPKATAINLNNATGSSFDVNFISSGTKFIIEYGPTGFVQGTGMTDTALVTGHTVGGLAGETVYDAYIQNDCSDSSKGYSTWSGPFTIKTLCSEVTGTYINNWDHLANNATDFCWSFLKYGTGTPYAKAYSPSSSYALQPKSGTNIYRWYNSSNQESYLSSPAFTYLDSNNMQVRFWSGATYSGTKTPALILGTTLTATDTASFTAVDTILPVQNVWNEFIIPLTNVPANHKYITLRNATTGNYVYISIEDFVVEYIPACTQPTSGTFSNTTDVSTILSWTTGGGNTYEIEYGVSGYTQGTGTSKTGLTVTTDTITGLTPQTCYDFYIRDNCTNNNSSWYGPITVCTECAIAIAPYSENFDGANWTSGYGSSNKIDDCWTRNPSTTGFKWDTRTGTTTSSNTGPTTDVSGTGNYIYTEASSGVSGNNAILLTPEVNFSALTNPTLSFSYHMYGATIGTLYVTVWDSIKYDTIFTISGQQHSSSTAPWTKVYVDLTAYKASPRKIRFVGRRGTSYTGDIAIDEVSIDEMPSCLPPTNFAIDSVSSTFADFSWSSISNGTAFQLEYGPVGFIQGTGLGTKVNTTTNPHNLTGLSVNTTYDIYLADACDTTNWVGPITFKTLINDDAQIMSIISPVSQDCGDSNYVVEVQVKNNGLNSINNLPVTVNVTGATSTSINTTYTNTIAPGASANVVVGNINTYNGGFVNVKAFTTLVGDQNTTNDTLSLDSTEMISVLPMHYPVDTLCADDTTGMFIAIPQTGITHNWYNNFTDTVAVASGDTLKVSPGQTMYLDRSSENSVVIQTGTAGSHFGTMFKLYIKKDFDFTGYTWTSHQGGTKQIKAFYRMGTYRGHETNRADWTLIDTVQVNGTVGLTQYRFDFANPVTFTAGDTVSIYLASKTGKYEAEGLVSKGAILDSVFKSNADFNYIAGVGGAYFGANMVTASSPSSIACILHWSAKDVCGNNRIPLTMGLNTDTAVATFTHNIDPNGADVTFDASAASGHTFNWNFGDGNTGTGTNPMHTYTNGTYNVTLVVTDTVCGTVDSMEVTLNATVSLSESLLGRTLHVFPNPNNGSFRIAFELEGIKPVELVVTDELGRIVYTHDLGNISGQFQENVNLESRAEGIYVLSVNVDGQTTYKKISVVK